MDTIGRVETRIYHLHPGSGPEKTRILGETLRKRKISGDFREMLCLFPTRTHLRHWQRKVFHPLAGDCYIPPEMLTLGNFATRSIQDTGAEVLNPALRPSIVSHLCAHGTGFSTLISSFIKEFKHNFPGASPGDIRMSLMESFEQCNIAEEVSANALKALDAYEKYETSIKARGYIDREDAYSLAAGRLQRNIPFKYRTLILDGFYELTTAELLLVRHLLKSCEAAYLFVPVSGKGELDYCYTNHICRESGLSPVEILPAMPPVEPRLNPAPSRDIEAETIARHIKQVQLSGSKGEMEDILIVFPDLKAYGSALKRVFGRYGVPLNHATVTPPDNKQGPWSDLLCMIRSVKDDFPRLEFSRFLMSPHFRKIPSEVRANAPLAALNSGVVKGQKAWAKALEADSAGWVFRTLEPLIRIRASASYDRFIAVIGDIMEAFVFHPGDSGPVDAAATLAKLSPCGLITGRDVSLGEFADSLESLLGSMESGEDSPGVEAANIFDVRGLEPETLYMGGLKDGDVPSRPDIDLLLPDSVRKRLGLVDIERHMDLQEKIFTRLRMSARELYLSYPAMEEDKVFLPSAFLSGITASPYPVSGHYCQQEEMTAWGGDSLSPRLKEITLPGVYGRSRTVSATEVDSYRRCPRRFAIERVMGMSPTEVSDYEMEPTELGSIVHRVMERMITGDIVSLDQFRQRAEYAIDKALSEYGADLFFSALIRESILSSLPALYELEAGIKEEGFQVQRKEEPLEAEPIPGIRVKGKADRIDINCEGKASIIDYKTGAATISGQALEARGESLQLFLYAAMLRESGMDTERVGIYSLKDMAIKWVPGKRDQKKGMHMDRYIETALSFLDTTITEMRIGDFTARPISASVCSSCHEVPFCPFFQSPDNTGAGNAV